MARRRAVGDAIDLGGVEVELCGEPGSRVAPSVGQCDFGPAIVLLLGRGRRHVHEKCVCGQGAGRFPDADEHAAADAIALRRREPRDRRDLQRRRIDVVHVDEQRQRQQTPLALEEPHEHLGLGRWLRQRLWQQPCNGQPSAAAAAAATDALLDRFGPASCTRTRPVAACRCAIMSAMACCDAGSGSSGMDAGTRTGSSRASMVFSPLAKCTMRSSACKGASVTGTASRADSSIRRQ